MQQLDWEKARLSMEKIADLVMDWRFYPRKQIDHTVVETYVRAMEAGANFPYVKIGLFRGQKIIVDGVHRITARKQLKVEYIECLTLPIDDEGHLFAEAVRFNSSHGKSFTSEETMDNIRRLKKYHFDVKSIQTLVSVPAKEIISEYTRPILSVRMPNGKMKPCSQIDPVNSGIDGEICLKNALLIVCRFTEAGRVPSDPFVKGLARRVEAALKKIDLS